MRVTTPSLSMSIQHVASALCMPTAPSYCPHSLNAKQRNVDATVKVVPSTILHNRPTIRDIYIRPLWEALGGLIAGHPRDLFIIYHGSPDRGESKWRANCRTRNCLLGVAMSNIQGHRFWEERLSNSSCRPGPPDIVLSIRLFTAYFTEEVWDLHRSTMLLHKEPI